ncbi:hypothetical protein GP486_003282 [Trichoglossum hirsutum]|uniref:NADH:flavin oxidoreductase/NADH oxidase N-terminal domain-containing protein n=1 Tax=Trichoglossum hirsutum TaxID=265104 RepID=A0A9P8LDF7_9PEZI|nr:hypothetical protein GP486_003282 [Trichoglossum hirsutum]
MTLSKSPYENPADTNVGRLFKPLKIGDLTLKHRIVLAPLTRARSPAGIPSRLNVEYYEQRATDGGLLITEATHISSGNYYNVPGIYTPEQIRAWRLVTSAVHAKGGFIVVQLWHVGRNTVKENMGGRQAVSSSPHKLEGGVNIFTPTGEPIPYEDPKEMSEEDMRETLEDYKHACRAAMEAGFDGVMIE